MPATNGLQPPLSPAERSIVKSYGDWTTFCHAFGLKPYDMDDNAEAEAIVKAMARDEEGAKGAKGKK
ncbi:hypothetical protein JCM10207_005413 [Rhodosporidiobolus poonsookiae]